MAEQEKLIVPEPIGRNEKYLNAILEELKTLSSGGGGGGSSTGPTIISANGPFTVIYEGMRGLDIGLKIIPYTKP